MLPSSHEACQRTLKNDFESDTNSGKTIYCSLFDFHCTFIIYAHNFHLWSENHFLLVLYLNIQNENAN